jgi:transposase-like protein
VARPTFPKILREFQSQFLAASRWPDGFVCPRCGNRSAYELVKLRRWQGAGCRQQISVTAQTTTDKRGVSALLLQRQLGLRRYGTAWMLLHKLRRAMVNLERELLRGKVEVDETWIGGIQAGLRGSRQLKGRKAALVLVAVEKRGRVTGRARMALIPDFKNTTLLAFLKQNVIPGSTVYTDGLKTFAGLQEAGFEHVTRTQPLRIDLRKGAKSVLSLADRAIGNLQQC